MPCVRRAGVIALAAALTVAGLAAAGCGVGRETTGMLTAITQRGDPSLAAGLVRPEDLPEGFRPATDHDVFRAFRPADADCRRLFAQADDGAGSSGVREAHTVLYQVDPGGSVEERLILLPHRWRAARQLRLLRGLGQNCRRFTFPAMAGRLDMRKAAPPVRRLGDDSYSFRYSARLASGMSVHFDWFAARVSRALLVLARSHLVVGTGARTTEQIAYAAVTRLRRLIAHQKV